VASQVQPSAPVEPAQGGPRVASLRAIPAREWWGYGVWFFVAVVFSIPEAWSGFGSAPWPTLSITVAHLEMLWPGTRVVIVGVMVVLIFQALKYPVSHAGLFSSEPIRGRTVYGRLTEHPDDVTAVSSLIYLLLAMAAVAVGGLITSSVTNNTYVLGYVIYGLFAIFLVLIPNALAFWFAQDVTYPTFFRAIANLERRWRPAALVIVASLVALTFHLVFFPWPNVPA
jgi:hypothetical protein